MAEAFLSWTSGDTLVAEVDSAGEVTATGSGATTVRASAGEASGDAVVEVMQQANSVVVSPPAGTITLGDTLRLMAEAFDENGHAVAGAVFAWTSSDTSVALVDGDGLVCGVAEGKATILATSGAAQGVSEIAVQNPDRAALVALYEATDGPNWLNDENWLTDAPLEEWYGVETDENGRVVVLDLSGRWDDELRLWIPHGLSGTIPAELGDLAYLERLLLPVNILTGPIPLELGNLSDLRDLQLHRNVLTGPIPAELGNLSNLQRLYLYRNALAGPIPPELGNLSNLQRLYLYRNALAGPIPPELGNLSNLQRLYLYGNALTGPIPPELGNLSNLQRLYLYRNALAGPIPAELGNLSNLEWLLVYDNGLRGAIPRSLLALANLAFLDFEPNDGLCAPGTAEFAVWLEGMQRKDGPSCNQADREALELLFETVGGSDWADSQGWLESVVLAEWYGVEADTLGRVVALDLTRNALAGELPASMGKLEEMTRLRLGGNALSGRLPLDLADLPLEVLHYDDTQVCAPVDASFRAWLNALSSHEGTGLECAPSTDRDVLAALYAATDGPNWSERDNWLTAAPLGEWYGVNVDDTGRVVALHLSDNELTGELPRALGNLANLTSLELSWNPGLTGPIPPELGYLASLRHLFLVGNSLSGPIPPELGNLAELVQLDLRWNDLSGSLSPELGNLASLQFLFLSLNSLSGPIPRELGNLAQPARHGPFWKQPLGADSAGAGEPRQSADSVAW